MSLPPMNVPEMAIGRPWEHVIIGQPTRHVFYAVFSDDREERLSSITVLAGELLDETLGRLASELGAVRITLKPEEAQAVIE